LLREQFGRVLRAQNRHIAKASLILAVFIALFILSIVVTGVPICGLVLLPVLAVYPLYRPARLHCPNCRNQVEKPIGEFCPRCASQSLQPGDLLFAPSCTACGKVMRNDKHTHYTIHACTHCGFWLDDEGL
jgi:hypothetical protein